MKMIATTADKVVQSLSPQTRVHAVLEGRLNPSFWTHFTRLASAPDPAAAINEDMMRTAINHFDPSRYTESAGQWPLLRKKLGFIQSQIRISVQPYVPGIGDETSQFETSFYDAPAAPPPAPVSSGIPGMVTSYDQSPTSTAPSSSASSTPDFWATLANTLKVVAPAVTGIVTSNIQSSTQQQIAQIQAKAAQGVALTQAEQQLLQQSKVSTSNAIMYVVFGLLGVGGLLLLFSLLKGRR
jgi:hypothetical protein